ncbi:hypothetical protein C3E97_007135 [Pseudomonas sp. MWU12-2115]|uniref:hypothetical protein n=1 Tax=unclassified Pseudomonas TaxID=196821 RepID=UPI000CD52702|nr:hypothetical protein [Pseudomonas sp. MWU12-2020]RBC02531.1 hypothetical protein C3E97_007135 [Pseudomonas sp. MWU12-2115]
MRLVVIGGAMVALATLAGCAGLNLFDKGPVVVDYHAGTTEQSGFPRSASGTDDSFFNGAGSERRQTFGPYHVRQCNAERTSCSLGLVILNTNMQILSVGEATAKLQVKIDYKVGAESHRDVAGVLERKLTNPEIVHDQGSVSRIAEIPYGEVRHVDLPYGLSYTLCVSAPGVKPENARPCANQLNVNSPASTPTF